MTFPASLFADCIGSVPVYGTGSSFSDCSSNNKKTPPLTTNSGPGAGKSNINVFTAPTTEPETPDELSTSETEKPIVAKHQVRLEIAPWIIPGAYQFDTPGMPERLFINGAAWEYYLNKSLSFGVLWQQFSKTGGRDFKNVSYTDASGDAHSIAEPGSLDRLKYTAYMPYVAINAHLSPKWILGGRFGVGRVEVEAEYSDSSGMQNQSYDNNTAMLFDMFIEYIWTDVKLGGNVRYMIANNNTDDYLEYINMGSAQIVFYAQWMLRDLGIY